MLKSHASVALERYLLKSGVEMKTLVTGATGFVGSRLLTRLDKPIVLSRDADRARRQLSDFDIKAFDWDPIQTPPPTEAFEGVEAVVHLAGDSVADGRWTAAKKERMRESRRIGTRNLVEALSNLDQKPKVLVSASAVGIYGDRGNVELVESSDKADDFLANICVEWEEESQRATSFGIRVANPRIGVVLGPGGGALKKMLTPFKMGVGAPLGSGRQWMPWIHLDDLVGMIIHAIENSEVAGPFNATSANPVTNREFTKTLGKTINRPTFFPPVPGFMMRLAFGEFASVLLASQKVMPHAIVESGYEFQFAKLEEALADVFDK